MNKPILQLCRSLKPTIAAVAIMVLAWPGIGRLSAQTSDDEQPVDVGLRK